MIHYATTHDRTVVCVVCGGDHLAKVCQLAASTLAYAPPEIPPYRPHGTLASAKRERRQGGAASMCEACREAWNTDQRRHRRNRAARRKAD